MYPSVDTPAYGAFISAQLASIAEAGIRVDVEFVDGRRGAWRYVTAVHRVRKVVAGGGFDLVHAHYGLAGLVAALQPLPLVVSFCGDDLLGTPGRSGAPTLKSRVGILCSHLAARRADAIICKSEELRARLDPWVEQGRVHVIPNGVDTRLFFPGDRAAARLALGLPPGELLILFPTSPTEHRKRHDLAVAAGEELRRRGLAARLLVVYGLPQKRLADFYRAADCLIMTSEWEGSPNCVKEALCCDLPVVTVDAGDVRRWLALTSGCMLVERSPAAVADGLQKVLAGTPRVDGSKVRAALDSRRIAAQVLAVYAEAIRARSPGGPFDGTPTHIRV